MARHRLGAEAMGTTAIQTLDKDTAQRDALVGRLFEAAIGSSVLHCLAVGMAESPPAGTGTVIRPPTLRGDAAAAGFRDVEIPPIENDFWRFYHLHACADR